MIYDLTRFAYPVELTLRSSLCRVILDDAMKAGRCPIGMTDLVVEMTRLTESWCISNCQGEFAINPFNIMQVLFTDAYDAMLFKLANG